MPMWSDPAWEPIETAPRDAIPILICNIDYPDLMTLVAYYHLGGFVADGVSHLNPQPTHWMPLPSPPEKK